LRRTAWNVTCLASMTRFDTLHLPIITFASIPRNDQGDPPPRAVLAAQVFKVGVHAPVGQWASLEGGGSEVCGLLEGLLDLRPRRGPDAARWHPRGRIGAYLGSDPASPEMRDEPDFFP